MRSACSTDETLAAVGVAGVLSALTCADGEVVVRGLPVELVEGMRPTCLECFRPSAHCLCNLIPRFRAHFNLLILQHPHERKKYYSTAPMVNRAIENSHLMRGVVFEERPLWRVVGEQQVYLLFPGEGSRDCQQVNLDEQSTVVVLDGTWSEAGKFSTEIP